jgi:hypothetical protein
MGPFLYSSENVMEKPELKMAHLFHARSENKSGLIVSLLVLLIYRSLFFIHWILKLESEASPKLARNVQTVPLKNVSVQRGNTFSPHLKPHARKLMFGN